MSMKDIYNKNLEKLIFTIYDERERNLVRDLSDEKKQKNEIIKKIIRGDNNSQDSS